MEIDAQVREVYKVYRVVIADDDLEFRRWLCSLLNEGEDFQVVGEADTGTEALRLVPLLMPDLVIADVYMPEMNGLEVYRYLGQHFPSIKVVLISAYDERICKRLMMDEGALAFIPKMKLSLHALRQALKGEG